ncbi:MAG: rhodanese-like domain-containing protein [Alphaproteobacteria bacterium]
MNFFSFLKNSGCPVCALVGTAIQCCKKNKIRECTITDLKKKKKTFVLVDVREQDERDTGFIPNAIHLPLSTLETQDFNDLPFKKRDHCIIYCRSGIRSLKAANILRENGFKNLENLTGGILAWERSKKT